MASPSLEHANTVGWYILEGYPWWPVYICDQFKLRPNLYQLGDGHKRILKKAKDFKKDYALVYYFGSHDFSLVKLNKGILKPWECSEKEMYLKGHPKHLMKKGTVSDELKFAIQEVEEYLSQPEDIRLPPHMVPSDLDPTLETPPPMERPELDEEDGGEDDAEMEDADGRADEEEEDAEEDVEEEDDEEEDGAKKKKPKKKAAAPKKEKKEKKETEKKEPKPKKEKKEKEKKPAKEKAAPKEKKEKKTKEKKTEDAEKSNDAAAKSKDTPSKLKRQRSSGSLNGEPTKAAKKEKTADVKAAASGAEGSGADAEEDMAVVLEREIRWVLSNAQYEELTTKMLRKVLEERLKRDLKQYRDTIKAVVARVIDEEEDAPVDGGADGGAEAEIVEAVKEEPVKTKTEDVEMKDVENEEPVKNEPAPEPVKSEKVEKEEKEEPAVEEPVKKEEEASDPQPTQEELTAKQLKEAASELAAVAADDERKILDILKPLKKLSDVTKDQLSDSGLLPRLVELRVNRKRSVSAAVGELATQWNAEDVIPPPKPVEEKDIVPLKEKLANAETSHDELLATIMELQEMSLEMSHLKSTGIARVVAGLRQHANDKVSIAAKNLRNTWMQLVEKGKQPSNLKKLEKLNEILESEKESEEAKLGVLNKLIKLSLTTQEIIESKIGVMVSKLRKSSNEQVVQAALKLRKKWKSEAEAS